MKVYALSYWEKQTALLVYQVAKGADDTWRMQTLRVSDKLDELDKVVPLGPARD